jgi:hypothetical protein
MDGDYANFSRPLYLLNSHPRKDTARVPSLAPQRLSVVWDCLQAEAQLHSPDLGSCHLLA